MISHKLFFFICGKFAEIPLENVARLFDELISWQGTGHGWTFDWSGPLSLVLG